MKTKKFGNHIYEFAGSVETKAQAESFCKNSVKKGYNARFVKVSTFPGYIYQTFIKKA